MRLDGQILALFLLEPSVGPALAVEWVKVVDIELRVSKGPSQVIAAQAFAEKVPVAEVRLGRTPRVRVGT